MLRALLPQLRRSAENIKELAKKFESKLGQPIPDAWKKGVHYHILDSNKFQVPPPFVPPYTLPLSETQLLHGISAQGTLILRPAQVGEIVVVTRSTGNKTIGIVDKVEETVMDVKVGVDSDGTKINNQMHRGVPFKLYGKLVDNVGQIVMLPDLGGVKFTEASADVLNKAVKIATSRGQQECSVAHVATALLDDKSGLASQILERYAFLPSGA